MIPTWKIKRELRRIVQKLYAIPESLWEPLVHRHHEKAVKKGLPVFDGDMPRQPRIALFLIYQPAILPQSIVQTCRFLVENGFSPLIVANGGLDAERRKALLPHVWKILERPNVGYDFGGYRDGIRHLQMWGIEPDKLLILNDSIWFPVLANSTLLKQMKASNADVVGTVLRNKGEFGFLESYLYLMDGAVLKHEAIKKYWDSYRLTANKYKVIRRGERGHSVALWKAGFRLEPMFSAENFQSLVSLQSDEFLENTIRFSVADTAILEKQRKDLLQSMKGAEWRTAVLKHIDQVLQSGQFYSAFPYASIQLLNYPILKRSSDRVAVLWRNAYLAAIKAGVLASPVQPVFAELKTQAVMEMAI